MTYIENITLNTINAEKYTDFETYVENYTNSMLNTKKI